MYPINTVPCTSQCPLLHTGICDRSIGVILSGKQLYVHPEVLVVPAKTNKLVQCQYKIKRKYKTQIHVILQQVHREKSKISNHQIGQKDKTAYR